MTDIQPALPDLDLPEHHGHRPVGMRSKLSGSGSRITNAHEIDDRLTVLAEVVVGDAGHTKTKDGLIYVEKLSVVELYEIEGQSGRRLLEGLRQQYRLAEDERNGRKGLPGVADAGAALGPSGWTDGSGRLLDDDELAEIRGDRVLASVGDDSLDQMTLVLSDGSKVSWPSDFPSDAGGPPQVGEFFGDLQVVKVFDADGATIAEWSSAEEFARLERLEGEVAAREDAEATAELLAPRKLRAVAEGDTSGYDELAPQRIVRAVRVVDELPVLFAVQEYESSGKARKTVLAAVSARVDELAGVAE